MYFLDKRIKVILNQLRAYSITDGLGIPSWQYKKGQFFRPEEADAAETPWEEFTSDMSWHATYDGTDQFEGKFKGYNGDFRGIHGEHYWFRSKVMIPERMDGKAVFMRISTQISEWDDAKNPQFLVFINGKVTQGADMNHREVKLFDSAVAGEEFTIDVQAYTGTMHMDFNFLCSLYVLDEKLNHLIYDIEVPMMAFDRLGEDNKHRIDLLTVLNETVNLIDMREPESKAFYDSIDAAQAYITENLYEKMTGYDEIIATCIGHTHIDVAWWWTVAQTREKVVRSFATALKLMEEYPNYKFMSSQPVLYYFLKLRYPEVFERIKQRVAEGRWEVEGGMWLEADCNLTSGESLVRQFIHGKRFFQEEFGKDNRVLWLPDVFGYSGALPQIMKKSGIDYFMTTKLSWNQINKIPYDTFKWRGIDGSEVLTHMITTLSVGQDPKKQFMTSYSGTTHPDAIMGGWERYQNKDINNDILVCYGHGDGGGGPTRQMVEISSRLEKGINGIPKVRQETARTYFEELDERVSGNRRLPVWEGEFYFEYHRGTYTSMARNKRGNRKSELLMMDLELLGLLAEKYPREALDRLWRDTILLNQFHDILPGTSIAEVYETTKKEYDALAQEANALIDERLAQLAGKGEGVTLFNTLGFGRNDVVDLGDVKAAALQDETGKVYPVQQTENGAVAYVENIPAKGYKTLAVVEAEAASPFVLADDRHLETPFYSVAFDENGHMVSIFDKENDRELVKPGCAINQMRLYEDKPIYFDNWDIDMYYIEKSWPVNDLISMKWTENGPVRATLEVQYRCVKSMITQKIHFYANTRRIDFESNVDWKEHQHLLKVEFPVDIHTDEATFDIQFGNVSRKIHTNTSWEQARFESCGQKWIDFSEGHYGVSVLNDCKYGHSVKDGVVSLTLIKCGVEPNQNTDVEMHYFTYALYPHAEDWRRGGTVQEGYKLNLPMYAVAGGEAGKQYSYASVDKDNVILETVKQAESGEGTVLRLYEAHNAKTKVTVKVPESVKVAYITNLLEQVEEELTVKDGKITLTIKPYEIMTVLLK